MGSLYWNDEFLYVLCFKMCRDQRISKQSINRPIKLFNRKQSKWKINLPNWIINTISSIIFWLSCLHKRLRFALRRKQLVRPNRKCNLRRSNGIRPFHLRSVRLTSRRLVLCGLLSHVSRAITIHNKEHIDSIAYTNEYEFVKRTGQLSSFDTDSKPIKIDNCSTRTMSGCRGDFITDTLIPVHNKSVRGYSGTQTPITHQGTIRWWVADDEGTSRELRIPNSFFVPSSTTRLLSPQHMSQQMNDNFPTKRGTWCATYDDSICLQWNQRAHSITVPLDPNSSNVGTIWTIPGYTKHHRFCRRMALGRQQEIAMEVTLFDDDDANIPIQEDLTPQSQKEMYNDKGAVQEPGESQRTDFLLNGPPSERVVTRCKQRSSPESDLSSELLEWHSRLSHISMKRLQTMALRGQLPRRLANCPIPSCQSCLFGKQTRRPWRTKDLTNVIKGIEAEKPGDCVSVDQLESSVPGLVGQLKGSLTHKRYKVATIFVDHFSALSFVHLQLSTNAEETLQAKLEFEKYARTHGVIIKRYHADNGRFSDNSWRNDVISQGQRLTFCGVGAHHQNGRAEKRIRDIQDLARTSLIYANQRWPDAVDARLWPYALRHANDSINRTIFPGKTETPLESFSQTKVMPSMKDMRPFGCPAYVLDGKLQGGNKIGKWASRSRLAINLGHSSQHARSVALVLSLSTGLVSPQFHVRFDFSFETIRNDRYQPRSHWQVQCGFEVDPIPTQLSHPSHMPIVAVIPRSEYEGVHTGTDEINDLHEAPGTPVVDQQVDQLLNRETMERVPQTVPTPINENTTRSGRVVRMPARYDDYVAFESLVEDREMYDPEVQFRHPVALAASTDPDVMYLKQALKEPDRLEFIKAMEKEVRSHTENANWKVMNRSEVPKGHTVLLCSGVSSGTC
jgi:GAG-pre-integrase domain